MSRTITMHVWVWALLIVSLGFQTTMVWRLQRRLRACTALMVSATKELRLCGAVIAAADRELRRVPP